jgi:hypothetical protein
VNSNNSELWNGEEAVANSEVLLKGTADKYEITQVLREMYKWYETSGIKTVDFPLTGNDYFYTSIDAGAFSRRIEQLQLSELFSSQFIADYTQIAEQIDKELKQGIIKYYVGYMPPYGLGANPWCNCQDHPDDYWQSLKVIDVLINNNTATLNWTWDNESNYGGFKYHVKLQKVKDKWIVSYLEGFDKKTFFAK